MTALCGGGPSGELPLTEPVINLTAAGLAALATAWGFPELDTLIALAGTGLDLVAADYCRTDPPVDPGLTQADVIAAMSIMLPGIALPAQAKVQQWFMHRYWWDICQCTSSQTPAPPVMSNPQTPVGTDTGAPSGLNSNPCWSITAAGTFVAPLNAGFVDATKIWLPSGVGSNIVDPGNASATVCIPPPGTVRIDWSLERISSTTTGGISFNRVTSGGADTDSVAMALTSVSGVQKGSHTFTVDATTPYLRLLAGSNPGVGPWTQNWNGTVSLFCSGSPPNSLIGPCCPPDPLIDIRLNQIYSLVLDLYGRPTPGGSSGPTGWIDGVRHSSLAGSGTLMLAGDAIGVRVEMTTLPAGGQVNPGSPTFYWDAGFITPYALESPFRGQRLVFADQSYELPAFTDMIGWTLLHGTVIDIVELLPLTARRRALPGTRSSSASASIDS